MVEAVSVSDLAVVAKGELVGETDPTLLDATHWSDLAGPGTLFVAFRGTHHDGHDFVPAAVAAGSPAVMVERRLVTEAAQLIVADCRQVAGPVAAAIHHQPSQALRLVGVTGTNGKTTVTHMLKAIAETAGVSNGLIGTIESRIGDQPIPNPHTTPEATDLQRILAQMAQAGVDIVAAEVSSHALALGRVSGAYFRIAAFTNLSQDHLDFHHDIESYYRTKASLFAPNMAEHAVINIDDEWGRRLAAECPLPITTTGEHGDVSAADIESSLTGSEFVLATKSGSSPVRLALGGYFNVENALVAAACAELLGFDLDQVVEGLGRLTSVPGRFERVSSDSDPITVIVDYAHTPEGIQQAIAAVTGEGRLIVVFGAGGDRDKTKRPLMGAAAARADLAIVTSDNPRGEDPEAIIDEIVVGIPTGVATERCTDRRQAIALAFSEAEPGDVVLILGKGHEPGQEIQGLVYEFDDRDVARLELSTRFSR